MGLYRGIQKSIYRSLKPRRWDFIRGQVDPEGKTLLEIGAEDLYFYEQIKDHYDVTLADIHPNSDLIRKENVEALSFEDKSFDIVLCLQVLEHTLQPVRAMQELKRVARRQLIISVPYEPFFTLLRFGIWEPEHMWAVTPMVLRHHLGPPAQEARIFFRRYYVGIWDNLDG